MGIVASVHRVGPVNTRGKAATVFTGPTRYTDFKLSVSYLNGFFLSGVRVGGELGKEYEYSAGK